MNFTRAIGLTSCDIHRRGPLNRSAKFDAATDFPARLTAADRSSRRVTHAVMIGMPSETLPGNISAAQSQI